MAALRHGVVHAPALVVAVAPAAVVLAAPVPVAPVAAPGGHRPEDTAAARLRSRRSLGEGHWRIAISDNFQNI